MARDRLGYVPALDGLRGVAIALVVCRHYTRNPLGGGLGVDLFFVLSGFLITTIMLEERAETGRVAIGAFYVRRARRLLPALAVMLAAYLTIAAARGSDGLSAVIRYGLYAGNLYQAFWAAGPHPPQGLEHLWSLAQEEQFYLIWPLLFLALARSRRAASYIAAAIVALVAYRIGLIQLGEGHARVYYGPDSHSEGLLLGAVVAFLRVRRSICPPPLMLKAALGIIAVAMVFRPAEVRWDAFGLIAFEVAAAVVVAGAVTPSELAPVFAWKPLVWLGRISYSLYLWHIVVLWAFSSHDRGVALIVSIILAWASYRFVEQPFRRRRQPRVSVPTVPQAA